MNAREIYNALLLNNGVWNLYTYYLILMNARSNGKTITSKNCRFCKKVNWNNPPTVLKNSLGSSSKLLASMPSPQEATLLAVNLMARFLGSSVTSPLEPANPFIWFIILNAESLKTCIADFTCYREKDYNVLYAVTTVNRYLRIGQQRCELLSASLPFLTFKGEWAFTKKRAVAIYRNRIVAKRSKIFDEYLFQHVWIDDEDRWTKDLIDANKRVLFVLSASVAIWKMWGVGLSSLNQPINVSNIFAHWLLHSKIITYVSRKKRGCRPRNVLPSPVPMMYSD